MNEKRIKEVLYTANDALDKAIDNGVYDDLTGKKMLEAFMMVRTAISILENKNQ